MKETLLNTIGLRVRYDQVTPCVDAVRDVSFSLARGECLGIIGESGCGKTSIAWALCGLHTEAGVTGSIAFGPTRLDQLNEQGWRTYRSKKIGLVFQNSLEALNPVMTVGAQVAEPLVDHEDLTPAGVAQRVEEMFSLVGLDLFWKDAYPHQLSGGMRQRVLLAMALVCRPEVLVVDEPTTSLDAASRRAILNMLKDLQRQMGFAMLLISHDLSAVADCCSRLMVLYLGRVAESGLVRDVLSDPRHPYTRGLVNASPNLLPYRDLWGIPGAVSDACTDGCAFAPRCCQSADICFREVPELTYVGLERQTACHKGGIETLLQGRNMTKTYTLPGDRLITAVNRADIEIRSGEVVALVGQSGSGKSTLAHMLAGILKADGGTVSFMGQSVRPLEVGQRPQGVQLVFQDPFSATSQRFTVSRCISEPLDILGKKAMAIVPDGDISPLVREVLEMVGLPTVQTFLDRKCHTLSGGQRQRVAFARALITQPKVVIADEVTSMLDPSSRANLLRLVKGLQNSRGFAMLFITHDLDLARKTADRILIMHEGSLRDVGFTAMPGSANGNGELDRLISGSS